MSNLLTNREKEVLKLIAYENTNDEIARKLYISNHTAKTHRKNLLIKLSVKNSAGLVRRGFELGLIPIDFPVMMSAAV
ncbi:MAG: response regulator transcription factor [Saprospiraceae bacterium]|nr:response regulator transcription factor [Saprospiraceae bacterium]